MSPFLMLESYITGDADGWMQFNVNAKGKITVFSL